VVTAARELEQEMARLRSDAIASRRDVAMRLSWSTGRYAYAFTRTATGTGCDRTTSTRGGIPLIGASRDLASRYEGIDFGLLDVAIPEVPPGSSSLLPGGDPVRFGLSDIITFTPHGTSSSGTLYVSDGHSTVTAVVVYGGTGRLAPLAIRSDRWLWVR